MKLITKPLGCLFSFVFILVLLLAIGTVILLWGAGKWGPSVAAQTIESRTGFPTQVGSHQVNLFRGVVDLFDVEVHNPAAFPDPEFLDVRELSVRASPVQLIGDEIVIDRVVIDIRMIRYINTNTDGNNVMSFAHGLAGDPDDEDEKARETREQDPQKYLIRELVFVLDTVRYEDYTRRTPLEREYNLNYEQTFTDVRNLTDDVLHPLTRELGNRGINFLVASFVGSLLEFGNYREAAEELLHGNQDLLEAGESLFRDGAGVVEEVGRTLRGLFE